MFLQEKEKHLWNFSEKVSSQKLLSILLLKIVAFLGCRCSLLISVLKTCPSSSLPNVSYPLRFSYDCYWGRCKFCSDKETHLCLNKEYDIKRMIKFCIDAASKSQIDGIYFLDSAIRPRDIRCFASEIINAGIRISWGTNLRFEKVFDDDDLIAVMKEAGCIFVKFGLESGSQRVLDIMNKGINVKIAASIISKFRKHGILVHVYVMAAYPGEKPEDRQMTRDFLLSAFSHPDNYSCSEFILAVLHKLTAGI